MSQGMKGDVSSAEISVQPLIMAQFSKKIRVFPEIISDSLRTRSSAQANELVSVVDQLVNRLVDVGQCGVALFLFKAVEHLGSPATRQFFQGTHVQIAVM
jgi:hypothetical protein